MESVSPMREFHNNCSTDRLTSKRWFRRLIAAFGLMLLLPRPAFADQQVKFVGTASSIGAGQEHWNNPANVTADDGVYSLLAMKIKNGDTTKELLAKMSGNKFTIPAGATINGITVTIEMSDTQAGGGEDLEIFIIKAGSTTGTNQDRGCSQPGCWNQALDTITWGGAANLWGTTWTAADINASDFGVSIRAESPNNVFFQPQVDYVQITITYTFPAFTDVTTAAGLSGISNYTYYGLDWGDYNNDGHPDLFVSGANALYKNDGDGTFSAGPALTGNDRGVHWGDYDNDGYLDFAACVDMKLSLNNGDETFTLQSNAAIGITSINNLGDIAWLDYNLDGRLDMWAPNGSSPYAYMYANNGGGTFSAIDGDTIGLAANTNGESTIVADYDGDGYTDILYRAGSVYLFHNDGDGTFTNVTAAAGISFSGTGGGYNGTAFGDYDGDGDLDLYGGQGGSNKLYRNNDNGTFTDVTSTAGVAGLSATTKGVAWGDYDNDGDLDLYVAQESAANQLYRNNGDGTFTDVAPTYGLDDTSASYGAMWEDYDLDGDLDLFVGGSSGASKLFRNNYDNTDYLRVRVVGGGQCATNKAGIGVRVELYDATNTTYLALREIGVASSLGSSEPKWAHFGGVDPNLTYTVRVYLVSGLSTTAVVPSAVSTNIGGTVIDQMLTITEASVPGGFTNVSIATGFDVATAASNEGSGLLWFDSDDDGDLDGIITGSTSSRQLTNNSAGASFTVGVNTGIGGRQAAMLDIDNDGDIDYWHISERLYENDGLASFTNLGNLGFSQPTNNEGVAAADVNHDGWCDLVMFSGDGNWIGHHQGAGPVALVGTNNVSYGLNDAGDFGNGDLCSSGDVNNDGYLDFFYNYGTGKLFLSDGDGTYTENASGISVVTGNSDKMGSAWGDYDNDGDLDIFVARYDSGSTGYLWRNDAGVFTDVTAAAGIMNTSGQRSACWGDFDNDGDLDLYLVTRAGYGNILYENQNDGTFVVGCTSAAAPGDGHDAVFVDYDNDGDLDLAITQAGATNTLLRNDLDDTNYLKVRVIGKGSGGTNRAAIGVRVDLYDAAGTTFLARREIGVARGFGGTEPVWLHFGGVDPATTYTVKVHLVGGVKDVSVVPSAVSTTIGATTIPQMLTIEETAAKIVSWQEVEPQ